MALERADHPQHSSYINFDHFRLLERSLRHCLHFEEKNSLELEYHESFFIVAQQNREAMEYAAGIKKIPQRELEALVKHQTNGFLFEGLQRIITALPNEKLRYLTLAACALDVLENQGQCHFVSLGLFKNKKGELELRFFDSLCPDTASLEQQAAAWQPILAAGLKLPQLPVRGQSVEAQEAADCAFHAVFNAVREEAACQCPGLSWDEITSLRKALDEQASEVALQTAWNAILKTRPTFKKAAEKPQPSQQPSAATLDKNKEGAFDALIVELEQALKKVPTQQKARGEKVLTTLKQNKQGLLLPGHADKAVAESCLTQIQEAFVYYKKQHQRSLANILFNLALFVLGGGVLYLIAGAIHKVSTQRFTFFNKPPLAPELSKLSRQVAGYLSKEDKNALQTHMLPEFKAWSKRHF